jgi:GGDEF domain-containing protein
MHQGTPRRRRARPVGDESVRRLGERGEELAKGWLIELIEQAPLARVPALASEPLLAAAPRLCAAVAGALCSERELAAFGPGGEHEALVEAIARELGAGELERALAALEALTAVVWSAALAELEEPEPELVAAVAERLARVGEALRAAAVRAAGVEAGLRGREADAAVGGEPPDAGGARDAGEPCERGEPRDTAVARDAGEPRDGAPAEAEQAPVAPMGSAPAAVSATPLWRAAIEEEIERARARRAELSLLAVELEDAERIRAVEPPRDAAMVLARFTRALRQALRREDLLACEGEGRAWVLARDSGRAAARALARRIADTVASAGGWRGAPLRAAVGVAVLGEDGDDAEALSERAEEAMLAALAAGTQF